MSDKEDIKLAFDELQALIQQLRSSLRILELRVEKIEKKRFQEAGKADSILRTL